MRKSREKADKAKLFAGIALSAVLAISIIGTQPLYTTNVYAVVYEDCDLDGFDDATGKALPWVGFDGTKGDSIPSGWDGVTYDSKGDYEASLNKNSSSDNGSGSSGNNNTSGNTNNNSSNSNSASGSNSSSGNKASDSSSSSGNSSKKSSSSSGSNSSSKSSSSGTKSSSSKGNSSNSKKTTNENAASNSGEGQSTEYETVISNAAEESTTAVDSKKKKSKKKKSAGNEEETTTEEETETTDKQIVLTTVGTLDINEVDGSIIHAGSDIVIKGAGFAGNVEDIKIEIHSDNKINLTKVNTAEDGSFEAKVYIPKNIEEGTHEIVLSYQGQEIVSQSIEVGPKVADTFIKAFTVGFSLNNKGLVPGLLILLALAATGILTTVFGGLFGNKASAIYENTADNGQSDI